MIFANEVGLLRHLAAEAGRADRDFTDEAATLPCRPVGRYRLAFPGNGPTEPEQAEGPPGPEEIAEMELRLERDGLVLLWSTTLKDYIAFRHDDVEVPPGFVPYTVTELKKLFRGKPLKQGTLVLVHKAKRHGAVVTRREVRHGRETSNPQSRPRATPP